MFLSGHEGRIGMAALKLTDGTEFDGSATYKHMKKLLPAYARPHFIRIQARTHAHTHLISLSLSLSHTHTHSLSHTHTHTHTLSHTHTHTHSITHTQNRTSVFVCFDLSVISAGQAGRDGDLQTGQRSAGAGGIRPKGGPE